MSWSDWASAGLYTSRGPQEARVGDAVGVLPKQVDDNELLVFTFGGVLCEFVSAFSQFIEGYVKDPLEGVPTPALV